MLDIKFVRENPEIVKEITKKFKKDYEDTDLAGKTVKLNVTIKAVKVRDLPAIDDDFAQDCNEKYKTLADMKADIKRNMEVAKDRRIRELKNNSLLEQLVKKNPFDIPASSASPLSGRSSSGSHLLRWLHP